MRMRVYRREPDAASAESQRCLGCGRIDPADITIEDDAADNVERRREPVGDRRLTDARAFVRLEEDRGHTGLRAYLRDVEGVAPPAEEARPVMDVQVNRSLQPRRSWIRPIATAHSIVAVDAAPVGGEGARASAAGSR